jgi:hypothetical protein
MPAAYRRDTVAHDARLPARDDLVVAERHLKRFVRGRRIIRLARHHRRALQRWEELEDASVDAMLRTAGIVCFHPSDASVRHLTEHHVASGNVPSRSRVPVDGSVTLRE